MSHTGHDLAYGDDKGRVWRMDLNTGKRHLVFNGKVNYATDTFVSADASTTAWDITPANGGKGKIDGYRKIGRNAQPLSHHAYALSQYGPLLTDQAGGAFYDANHPVLLHTFGGGTAAVLPVGKYQQLPEIAGKVIGWISDDYHLQVASFRPAR